MKRTSIISILARGAGIAFATALLISPASCKKEKEQPGPHSTTPPPSSSFTIVTEKAKDQEIELRFAIDDIPIVSGATETYSNKTDEWLEKKYKLTSDTITIKGAITRFSCARNSITSLYASGSKALVEIYCNDNFIKNLDVSGCWILKKLYCNENSLKKLDISNNTKLEVLNCSSNSLTSLDVTGNKALTSLYCDKNALETLDVSGNNALTELSCANNRLKSLDVSKNKALIGLVCYKNTLTSLDVRANKALEILDCSSNRLISLDASGCEMLRELNCSQNCLTGESLKLPTLKDGRGTLYFKNEVDGDSQFLTPKEVERIESSWDVEKYNGGFWVQYKGDKPSIILTIKESSVGDTLKILHAGGKLIVLGGVLEKSRSYTEEYQTNKYRITSSTIKIVGEIKYFSYKNQSTVTSLDARGCENLEELSCEENKFLTSFDVSGIKALKTLYCDRNDLQNLNVGGCENLKYLYCGENSLKSLDVSGKKNLKILSCHNNSLTELNARGCENLLGIYCYKNSLTAKNIILPIAKESGSLYFRDESDGDTQTLTRLDVEQLEDNYNWHPKKRIVKGDEWIDYPGE